jgi:hypothetical protein
MRYGLLVLAIGIGLGLSQGWIARAYDQAISAALTDDARLAIEIRCEGQTGRSARECRSMLKRLYLGGSLDPDTTLRTYCDSVKHARWGGSLPPPPKLCVQRYGGWRPG